MRSTRLLACSLALSSLLGVAGAVTSGGCTGPRGVAGSADCTVVATGDGGSTRTITCADGTSVSVSNGDPGTRCTVGPIGDGGARGITCDDGTSVTIADGKPGTSCTVVVDGGAKTLSCGDGTSASIVPDPLVPAAVLGEAQDLPGLVVQIVSLGGASGPAGVFQIGDSVSVTFTVRTGAGLDLPLSAVDDAAIWIAGPTSHYQRVLPAGRDQLSLVDVKTRALRNADGSYTYTFANALPTTYGPPLFDTTKFTTGELTGQPLEHGTYTLALRLYRTYAVGTASLRDVGSQTLDFALGAGTDTAAVLEPRAVVTTNNCNQCHRAVQAHGGTYRDVNLCLTCHTAGAEDRNSTDTGDSTPVTIEFGTLIHKLHSGAHLPSVLGVGVNPDGTRSYAATPVPYIVGGGTDPSNFSDVQFPVWPSLSFPTPRNKGYSALTAAQQAIDDQTRTGVIACEKCHGGNPAATPPLAAPAQGTFAYSHPSKQACGSCHDDVDWTQQYKRNNDTGMMAQPDDSKCLICHPASGFGVGGSAVEGHRHPLHDSTFNPGLDLTLTGVSEAGASNANGKVDVGEKIAVKITVADDTGAPLPAASLPALSVIVTGPTSNRNLVLSSTIPAAALSGAPPFALNLPEAVNLERLGLSTAATGDVFTTARKPVWTLAGAATTVLVRTATQAGSTLAAGVPALANVISVVSGAGFVNGDFIAIDDGVAGLEEYLKVQWVDGNRLWFAGAGATGYQPGTRLGHLAGASVSRVTLVSKTAGTDYTIAAATGTITEATEFGAGAAVLASYTTDFVMPAIYGPPFNDSPDLGEAAGKWKGLPIVPGTYTVGVWGSRTLTLTRNGETNTYRSTSAPATVDFLVGAATALAPVAIIDSTARCESCHTEIYAHGGSRRGGDTCLLCHGNAGTEDRPRYVAPMAPATPRTTVEFRTMLHKIHQGSALTNAATYGVVGFGAAPLNFGVVGFGDVEFPAMPAGTKDCASCHGQSVAWQSPADRSHPTAATVPARAWSVACGSCHDSTAAQAHLDIMTSGLGNESCATCHAADRDLATTLVHKVQ